jgi:hypothetical protein
VSPARSAALDPNEVAVKALLVGILGLTIVESLEIIVNRSFGWHGVRHFMILYGEWLFLPVAAVVTRISLALGKSGILVAAAVFTICFLLITQFRGVWVWNGTFDKFEQSSASWLIPSLIGAVVAIVHWIFVPRTSYVNSLESATNIMFATLSVSILIYILLLRVYPVDSVFAPTRHFALMTSWLVLFPLTMYTRRNNVT